MNIHSLLIGGFVLVMPQLAPAQTPCEELAKYPVRFAILGDRTGSHQEGVYEEVVEEVARMRPDFVMTVGDMIEGYTSDTAQLREQWQEYLGLVKPLTAKIYYTPGNHDITTDAMEPAYRAFIGDPYYSFDHRGIHIVVLDNGRWDNQDDFPAEQLTWLRGDLASNRNACYTLVFFHQPYWYRARADGQEDTLHNVFKEYGVDAVYTGHFHKYFSGEFDGIQYTSLGSSGGWTEESPTGLFYHFGWVTIDGAGIHTCPIEKGAVRSWTDQTVGELRAIYKAENFGMTFARPLQVTDDMTLAESEVTVILKNQVPGAGYADTLRWNLPEGWSVEPEILPFTLSGSEPVLAQFAIQSPEKIYPLPAVTTRMPFNEHNTAQVSRTLEVARTVLCAKATQAVTIDGKLDESCWQWRPLHLFSHDGNPTTQDSAAFCFAYDKNNLYMAVYCHERIMDSLCARMTSRDDDVYTEDAVGLLFQPQPTSGDVYQFYVNPLGTVYDQRIAQQTDGYWVGLPSWNGMIEVKALKGGDHYVVEARIPLDQFGVTADSGDQWRLNFRRKQCRLGSAAAFQAAWQYDPTAFGALAFE